jgi:HEAT repeat protein
MSVEQAIGDSYQGLLAAPSNTSLPSQLRATACWLIARLNRLDKKDAMHSLAAALGDDKADVRAEAVRGLAQLPGRNSLLLLSRVLENDSHPEVRKAAAYALGSLGGSNAIQLLKRKLSDVNEAPAVRGMSAEMLGQLGAARAFGTLLEGLRDAHPEVRFWSIFALGALGNLKAIDPLLRVAMNDQAELENWGSLREEALEAIRRIVHDAASRQTPPVEAASKR